MIGTLSLIIFCIANLNNQRRHRQAKVVPSLAGSLKLCKTCPKSATPTLAEPFLLQINLNFFFI
jgi:hypothetical protein